MRCGRYSLRSVTLTLMCSFMCLGQTGSQDVGSFLAGLFGAAEVPTNATSIAQNQVPCPGECVHAFTSILCSRVIEQFDCGAGYLKCCVSNDFNFGTVVETSAPLPEESSTDSSTEYEIYLVTARPSHELTTNFIQESASSSLSPTIYQPRPTPKYTTIAPSTTTQKLGPCRGICVENIFVRYCSTTIPGWCEKGSTCCASSQDDDNPPSETTTLSIPISWTTNKVYDNKPQTDSHASIDTTTSTTTMHGPVCPGSCVAPLFSLLCDAVNVEFYCPNDGRCCMNNDEETNSPTTTTTVPSLGHFGNPCPGACIPIFLRGMCNRPSEIMLQSDCDQDFICCYQPDVKDHLHVESPQIPLLRPGGQQSGFPSAPAGPQSHSPPMHQHPMQHPYPQRPQIAFSSKPVPPVMVPHIHHPGSGNQIYLGTGQGGYHPVPQNVPQGNNPYNKPPYPQNNNYGIDANDQSHFSNRPHQINSSVGVNAPNNPYNVPNNPYNKPPYPQNNNYGIDANDQSHFSNRPHQINSSVGVNAPNNPYNVPNNPYNKLPYPQNNNYGIDANDQSHFSNRPHQINSSVGVNNPNNPYNVPNNPYNKPTYPQNNYGTDANDQLNFSNRPHQINSSIVVNAPNNPFNKPSHAQNSNYGNDGNDQPHFSNRPHPMNISVDVNPVKFNGGPPQPSMDTPQHNIHVQQTYDNRRQNFSHAAVPLIPNGHASNYPPNGMHHDSSRFIPQPVIQNPKPVMQPEEYTNQRRPQNPPDRLASASVGFAQDSLRPSGVNFINPPPQIERFRPPTPQENSPLLPVPNPSSNTSTLIATNSDKPPQPVGSVHEVSIPKVVEKPQTAFKPVQESFRPVQNQPRPIQAIPQPQQTVPTRPPAPVPSPIPDKDMPILTISNNGTLKKLKPECPGSCIGSFLRFTCFGNSAIYDGFSCESEGTLCCTSVEHIEKYEEHLKSGNPLVLVKPDEGPKVSEETNRRPGMYVCGIKGNQRRKTGRVVGGKTSAPGEWCWQVALINAKNQYLCGGALIGSRWVLTAAHCITALVRNGDAIYVRVGDYDLASQYGTPGAQTQKVSTSYIHHNHNGQTLDNDIALLRLENPVQLQDSVCLVCLPARGAESHPGKRCTVTGYGYMDESGPIALKIREAVLPIVEEKLCTEQVNKVTEKRFIMPAGSFCAGGEPGNDACQGDGGGPLTCESDGYYELTGLVSWGFGCGKENVPGVYVKVSAYIGWVNQIISVNN